MKKMLLATAALAVIASPVLAQSGTRNATSIHGQAAPFYGQATPFDAYAQSRSGAFGAGSGQTLGKDYVGTDPDPNVRLQLLKDAESRD